MALGNAVAHQTNGDGGVVERHVKEKGHEGGGGKERKKGWGVGLLNGSCRRQDWESAKLMAGGGKQRRPKGRNQQKAFEGIFGHSIRDERTRGF